MANPIQERLVRESGPRCDNPDTHAPGVQLSNTTPIFGEPVKSAIPGARGTAGTCGCMPRLVRPGRAVAYFSLEDIQTCRVLEVPLRMFNAAACHKTRLADSGFAKAVPARTQRGSSVRVDS